MTPRKRSVKPKSQYNGWRVLNTFLEGIFQLLNSNKVYPAFGLVTFFLAAMIIYRLPDSELADIVKTVINEIIVGKGVLIFLLVATNLMWLYLINRQKRMYEQEIDRLAAMRSELMHGNGTIIERHRSSHEDEGDALILPAPQKK